MKYIYGQMETNEIDEKKKEVEKEYATGLEGTESIFCTLLFIFLFNQLFYVIPLSLAFFFSVVDNLIVLTLLLKYFNSSRGVFFIYFFTTQKQNKIRKIHSTRYSKK